MDSIPINSDPNKDTKAIITAIFEKKEYKSCELLLVDGSIETKIVMNLAADGTNNLASFKMPISDSEFMVFSRFQLDNTLFRVKIWDEPKKAA